MDCKHIFQKFEPRKKIKRRNRTVFFYMEKRNSLKPDRRSWYSGPLKWIGEKSAASNPHALKLEPSDVGTIKKLTARTKECREKKKGGHRTHFEKQIIERDKRRNVIFSKQNVIEVE